MKKSIEDIKKEYRLKFDHHTHTIYSRVGPYFHGKGRTIDNARAAAKSIRTQIGDKRRKRERGKTRTILEGLFANGFHGRINGQRRQSRTAGERLSANGLDID